MRPRRSRREARLRSKTPEIHGLVVHHSQRAPRVFPNSKIRAFCHETGKFHCSSPGQRRGSQDRPLPLGASDMVPRITPLHGSVPYPPLRQHPEGRSIDSGLGQLVASAPKTATTNLRIVCRTLSIMGSYPCMIEPSAASSRLASKRKAVKGGKNAQQSPICL